MSTALFVGRFQPFHNGHLSIVERALASFDAIKIAVGSSQYSHQDINPFSFEERKVMIESAITNKGFDTAKIEVIAVPDINDDQKWVSHVQECCGNFDTVVTGENPGYLYIKKLFEEANIPVEVFTNILNIEASRIRELILTNNNEWKSLLPIAVITELEKIDGISRIQSQLSQGSKKT